MHHHFENDVVCQDAQVEQWIFQSSTFCWLLESWVESRCRKVRIKVHTRGQWIMMSSVNFWCIHSFILNQQVAVFSEIYFTSHNPSLSTQILIWTRTWTTYSMKDHLSLMALIDYSTNWFCRFTCLSSQQQYTTTWLDLMNFS